MAKFQEHHQFTKSPSGPVFTGLNGLRALSVIALVLVFVANITTVANDAKAVKAVAGSGSSITSTTATASVSIASATVAPSASATSSTTAAAVTTSAATHNSSLVARAEVFGPTGMLALASNYNETLDAAYCNYIKDSTIPAQSGGEFWSILNRVFILMESILLILSEIGWPKRLFTDFVPMLGPNYGLGCLGVLQAMVACSVLSHHSSLFPQLSSWLLFIVGVFNMLIGIFLREKAKATRSLFKWENYANVTPQTKMAATGVTVVGNLHDAFSSYKESRAGSSSSSDKEAGGSRGGGGNKYLHAPAPHSSASSVYSRQQDDVEAGRGGGSSSRNAPVSPIVPGARFGGFGFGRQAENKLGAKISFPLETVPRYAV